MRQETEVTPGTFKNDIDRVCNTETSQYGNREIFFLHIRWKKSMLMSA